MLGSIHELSLIECNGRVVVESDLLSPPLLYEISIIMLDV